MDHRSSLLLDARLYTELWKACAAPLFHCTRHGDQAYYFPQGHLEQFEESTDYASNLFHLPSKILCRALNINLRAEQDNDDVYAEITLLPEGNQTEPKLSDPQFVPPRAAVYSFSKVLTASDIDTRYGLYVPRKHATKCLPPLDMSQRTPTQQLIAKDIHGAEWNFKHTFKGRPPRHVFTTGWNSFVSSKRLIAGDKIVFLRGENGEMRIGFKRLSHPKGSYLTSGIYNDLMLTIRDSIRIGCLFTVICKPRLSQFIIPLNKYLNKKKNFSIGMRIKMSYEVEDTVGKRCHGTIVGLKDTLRGRWPCSLWRSLKIQWDGSPSFTRQENVCPWEIELLDRFMPPRTSGKNQICNDMPLVVLQKEKRKLHKEPELDVEGIEGSLRAGPCYRRVCVEDPTERLDNRCLTVTHECIEMNHEEGFRILDDAAPNLGEDEGVEGTNQNIGSIAVPLISNSFQDETELQPRGSFTNQIPLNNTSGGDQLGHINNFGFPLSDSPDNTVLSDGTKTWLTNIFQEIDQGEHESGEGTSSHQQPLPGNTDPMPLEGPLPLAYQPFSSDIIYISSIPSLIPYNGPGRGDEQVPWMGYLLARRCIPLLERVRTRYPQLLSSFKVTNKALQSLSLEMLAEVVYTLEHLTVGSIYPERLGVSRQYLNDLKVTLKVDWIEERLLQLDAEYKKDELVRRREELSQEVESTNAKFRQLNQQLESVDKELREVTSKIGSYSLIAGQSLMQGLL